ncbi:hypothetical protein RN001_003222 [Aquatica leii]|uniref:Uncharacterized protein n=1 Tax=Aquatica leii TaxID=1421715 RepID=A0AAN7SDT8_9COLE|nr:hypothetical protein RN001_003222 [Aquatica leii]
MDPHRLLRDELEYELLIRGVANTSAETVNSMKKKFRDYLSKERFGELVMNESFSCECAVEIEICLKKINDLTSFIDNFKGGRESNEAKLIETKLSHLYGRLTRLKVIDQKGSKESLKAVSNLVEKLKQLEEFVDKKNNSVVSNVGSLSDSMPIHSDGATTSINDISVSNTCKMVPVHKWDYNTELWSEIRARVQTPNEKVGNYFACMINLFARLTRPASEEEKLAILSRNVLPYYIRGIGLHSYNSVEELLYLCKKLESSKELAEGYRCPRLNKINLLEPDLAAPFVNSKDSQSKPVVDLKVSSMIKGCLLESEASQTVVGGSGWEKLKNLGIQLESNNHLVTVADGRKCKVLGLVQLLIKLG